MKSTEGDIDWINGFIETYGDAIGKRASYESIVQITDFEASEQMQVVTQNVQWFEDNAPLMEEHKKPDVKGVSYKSLFKLLVNLETLLLQLRLV